MDRNQDLYREPDVAAGYAGQSDLQKPEATILRLLEADLPRARMLDLGVGGGRTTVHFAHRVREYVGTDYSPSMIAACRRRFAVAPKSLTFEVADARAMPVFPDHSFDVVLFSFNGIDYVDHADRMRILAEVRRVGKPGGWFCFSSHNLNTAVTLFEWRRLPAPNVITTARRAILKLFYNRGIRPQDVRTAPYLVINDGAHHRKLRTYYIRPEAQVAQLAEGFTGVRVFALDGSEITGRLHEATKDVWLYYLCRIR